MVKAELEEVAGARTIQVSVKNQSATVIFDPTKVDVSTLRSAIDKAGYAPKSETVIEGK